MNELINKEFLAKFLENFATKRDMLKAILFNYCNDRNNSFEGRKEIFLEACNLDIFPIDGTYHNFDGVDWNKKTLFDDFYVDKYATFKVSNLDSFEEHIEDIEAAYEYFMEKGIRGFINNW